MAIAIFIRINFTKTYTIPNIQAIINSGIQLFLYFLLLFCTPLTLFIFSSTPAINIITIAYH